MSNPSSEDISDLGKPLLRSQPRPDSGRRGPQRGEKTTLLKVLSPITQLPSPQTDMPRSVHQSNSIAGVGVLMRAISGQSQKRTSHHARFETASFAVAIKPSEWDYRTLEVEEFDLILVKEQASGHACPMTRPRSVQPSRLAI